MSADLPFLIVNADDLGRSPGVNAGIFAAHRDGLVTSATLMVGFPAAVDAARALADHPRLGVGLHVTLTGAAPTLPVERLPSLVDAAGRLPRRPDLIADPDPGEVEAEVRHQLSLFRSLTGRLPTHLDSHHHSHRHPVALAALVAVAREHRLPVRAASPAVAAVLRKAGTPTTDAFEDRFYGERVGVEDLLSLLDQIGTGSCELMCHPGLPDAELRGGSTYVEERQTELATLCHPEVRDRVRALGVTLGHFGDLLDRRGGNAAR